MPPSWNDIRIRAKEFADGHKDDHYERGQAQIFWYEFFQIFGLKVQQVALYEKSVKKLGEASGFIDLFWPGTLIVEHKSRGQSLEPAFDQAADYATKLSRSDLPRYIIVSDFKNIRLFDLATVGKQNEWQISLKDLPKKIDLFSFIAGYNKPEYIEEHEIDAKAVKQISKLHDELRQTGYGGEDLEILLVRILFCLFAEDGNIFEKGQFHDYIYHRTAEDALDLGPKLIQLFQTLNKPVDKRQSNLDEHLQKFRYVNGKLFEKNIETPTFNHNMRYTLLDSSSKTTWSEINPAIFGAMFQNVMQESGSKKRRELGAHYTSEKNILKVIKPLFLDELKAEFEEVKQDRRLLNEFHTKLANLKFLDPACGCGNFLVVAYRELRRLELEVLRIKYGNVGDIPIDLNVIVECNVDQFYGIEIEEFPSQVAQVAMWLTDAQMNNEASDVFHKPLVRLPLTHSASIVRGDALELDWLRVIYPSQLNYILGNPPFSGGKLMSQAQRNQVKSLFPNGSGAGVLDFVAGWYAKAINYIQGTTIKVAFVSTNSITQGEQVGILWKHMLEYGAKINFAHKTFKWNNEAGGKAAVYCVIIGFGLKDNDKKALYEYATPDSDPVEIEANHINPYLVDYEDVLITKRSKPICNVPEMNFGNMPLDGGNLLFTDVEKEEFLALEPKASIFIKELISAREFLNGEKRWCLWLLNAKPSEISAMPEILKRIQSVKDFRLSSIAPSTKEFASTPSLFRDRKNPGSFIVIPSTTSENRPYIPMGFFDDNYIANNSCHIVPGGTLYHFGVLESEMHMTWMRYVAGRLKSDYRYSKDIVYNNFPWPKATTEQQGVIELAAQNVLNTRAQHPESTLAELYNLLTMPPDLVKAHRELDKLVDKTYRKEPFTLEDDRIKYLFELYKTMS